MWLGPHNHPKDILWIHYQATPNKMATSGEAEIATRFPVVDGIIAKTTTQTGHIMNLEVE